jgi:2-dehydropantoate 2-reductase
VESVDPGGAVSAVLAPERAVGCVVYTATELEGPGVVRHLEGTRFSVGEPDRTVSARCRAFGEAMVAGGLKCPVEPDLRGDIWIKLLGNISFNPISALARATMRLGVPPPGECLHGGTRKVIETMMVETMSVARALGCEVGVSIERRMAGAPNASATTAPPRSRTWSAADRWNSTSCRPPSSSRRTSRASRCPPCAPSTPSRTCSR